MPAIKKLNPKLKLPSTAIAVVHRSDGSGTTFNFTNYLAKVSADWKSKVGANASVEWPVGIGAKGNEGVANNVANTKGSIGYVEYAYAKQNKLTFTKLVNKDGKPVAPDDADLPGRRRQRRLGQSPGLLSNPDRPAGRAILADHRRDLHPGATSSRRTRPLPAEALEFFDWAFARAARRRRSSTIFRCPTTVVGTDQEELGG